MNIKEHLKRLQDPNCQMPQIYSFTEARQLLKEQREEMVERLKKAQEAPIEERTSGFNYYFGLSEAIKIINLTPTKGE